MLCKLHLSVDYQRASCFLLCTRKALLIREEVVELHTRRGILAINGLMNRKRFQIVPSPVSPVAWTWSVKSLSRESVGVWTALRNAQVEIVALAYRQQDVKH